MNLPNKKDFGDCLCLDINAAWKAFGGLTHEQAYEKFLTNPDYYQENFVWMETKAFVFYFPVLEKYLLSVEPFDELDDCCFSMLAFCMESQFQEVPAETRQVIHQLSIDVLNRLIHSKINNEAKKNATKKWKRVKDLSK